MTRGRRMLLGLLQLTTAAAVGARCRVAFQKVSAWANGEHLPSVRSRVELERNYGIPATAWDVAWRNPPR